MATRTIRIGNYPDYRDEIRGTLSEILASTANTGTYAAPEDVTGTSLEMGSDGMWTGASVGYLTQGQADTLAAFGGAVKLKVGTPAVIAGNRVRWTGTTWQSDLIVGPFTDISAANAWAAANPSSLFNGLLATAAGVQIRCGGGVWFPAAATYLSRRVRIATFGYSIDNFSPGYAEETQNGPIPGGSTANQPAWSGSKMALAARSKGVQVVANCGISGQATSDMLARSALAISSTRKAIYDCIVTRPDVVFMAGPLVNDAQVWTTSTDAATVSASVERTKAIISALASSVPYVAFVGCMGINPSGWASDRLLYVQGLVDGALRTLEAWAAQFRNVDFLNPEGRLSVLQSWIAGLSDDGIHPNIVGGKIWAGMMSQYIDSKFVGAVTDLPIYDFNRDWATIVSNRPTGCTTTAVSGSTVGSTSVTDGVWSQAFETPSASAGLYFEVSTLDTALASAGLVSGESFFVEWDIELLKADGSAATNWRIESFTRLYNATNEAGAYFPTQSEIEVASSKNGWCTPIIKLDRDASLLGTNSGTRVTVKPMAIGSWILKVSAPKLRKYTTML